MEKAKARLCVLGFQDPDLTEVPRDSPTLSAASEASHKYRLISGDIKTAFHCVHGDFRKIIFKESPRVKTTLKVLNIVDAASGMHIAIQIADQTAKTIWRAFATWLRWACPRCLRVDHTGLR